MANPWWRSHRAVVLLLLCLCAPTLAANFDACKAKVEDMLADPSRNHSAFDVLYHGKVRGLKSNNDPPGIMLTLRGCREVCGSSSDPNDVLKAFQILTTWVLPAVALLSQLPYESLSGKKWKNLEALFNWVGSPASALTTTIFNIHMIRKARHTAGQRLEKKNAYYVLSCMNQYEYRHDGGDKDFDLKRDKALLYGLLRPIAEDREGNPLEEANAYGIMETPRDIVRLQALLDNLAFQLRLQRRKAVWPLAINIMWFLLAFIFSIVQAFADLGDNSTAHSLALGLLLSWLPVLVVMTIVDRNPVDVNRCQALIERWLYNVYQIMKGPDGPGITRHSTNGNAFNANPTAASNLQGTNSTPEGYDDSSEQHFWHQRTAMHFSIGEFTGQGRRLHYCGVANAVFKSKEENEDEARDQPQKLASLFQTHLKRSPGSWWLYWLLSQIIVSISFGMAFMVSFKTPTIGLGCRSLCYLIYYLLGMFSWVCQAYQAWRGKPLPLIRPAVFLVNGVATLGLFLIMMLQVTNGLNRCLCKVSNFGLGDFGGYMDFENAQFYRSAYEVTIVWITATVIGFSNSCIGIGFAVGRWNKDAGLWRVDENKKPLQGTNLELDARWVT